MRNHRKLAFHLWRLMAFCRAAALESQYLTANFRTKMPTHLLGVTSDVETKCAKLVNEFSNMPDMKAANFPEITADAADFLGMLLELFAAVAPSKQEDLLAKISELIAAHVPKKNQNLL